MKKIMNGKSLEMDGSLEVKMEIPNSNADPSGQIESQTLLELRKEVEDGLVCPSFVSCARNAITNNHP